MGKRLLRADDGNTIPGEEGGNPGQPDTSSPKDKDKIPGEEGDPGDNK